MFPSKILLSPAVFWLAAPALYQFLASPQKLFRLFRAVDIFSLLLISDKIHDNHEQITNDNIKYQLSYFFAKSQKIILASPQWLLGLF